MGKEAVVKEAVLKEAVVIIENPQMVLGVILGVIINQFWCSQIIHICG